MSNSVPPTSEATGDKHRRPLMTGTQCRCCSENRMEGNVIERHNIFSMPPHTPGISDLLGV